MIILLLATLIGLAFILGPLIAIGLSTIPGIELIPVIGSYVAWGTGNAWMVIPIGVGILVLSSSRSLIWTAASIILSGVLVAVFLGSII